MRPVDGSISIFLPNAPDNKRADFGESLVHVSGNLIHPSLIWMRCYPCNLNATALEMYKVQHIVSDQATQCENFHGEEVGSSKNVHVSANKVFPRRLLLSLRHGRDAISTEDVAHRLIR